MVIEYSWFSTLVINQDWKHIKTPNELLLLASPPKNKNTAFFGYVDADYHSPIYVFKPNSIIHIRAGRVYFNTDDIIKPKPKVRKQKK